VLLLFAISPFLSSRSIPTLVVAKLSVEPHFLIASAAQMRCVLMEQPVATLFEHNPASRNTAVSFVSC
tara:strand:- start:7838 stop:8041 length:204 start_codon:yes stop_codon:yes gene_type:complete